MPQNPTQFELKLFFNNPILGVFFMKAEKPVRWIKGQKNEDQIEYLLHHLRIHRVNDTMLKQYGATLEDFIGRTPADFFAHDLDKERQLLFDIMENGRFHAITTEKDELGALLIFEGDYQVIYDKQERMIGMMGIQLDITQRLQQLNAIHTQNQKLLNIAWQQSHVVRAPLARLMSLIQLLQHADEYKGDLFDHILDAANELDGIIKQIASETDQVRSHLNS